MTNLNSKPLFVLGMLPRSGTNFFFNLLRLHPHCNCVTNSKMNEDYLLYHADLLVRYTTSVGNYWRQYWKDNKKKPFDEGLKEELLKGIGDGIISYLNSQYNDGRLLATKTPQVRNLKYFFKLFPNARLIILIRDGHAVVESLVQSFGWSYEKSMQHWAEAAKNILEFEQAYKNTQFQYLIIKYEDILDNLEKELSNVFNYLELDTNLYDFAAAHSLPVMGSSQYWKDKTNNENCQTGWKRVEKTLEFNPKLRGSEWSKSLYKRYNWIAGDCMKQFGYYMIDQNEFSNSDLFFNSFYYQLLDKRWQLRNKFKSLINITEKNFYALSLYNHKFLNFIPEE